MRSRELRGRLRGSCVDATYTLPFRRSCRVGMCRGLQTSCSTSALAPPPPSRLQPARVGSRTPLQSTVGTQTAERAFGLCQHRPLQISPRQRGEERAGRDAQSSSDSTREKYRICQGLLLSTSSFRFAL